MRPIKPHVVIEKAAADCLPPFTPDQRKAPGVGEGGRTEDGRLLEPDRAEGIVRRRVIGA
jgi:hypothetical protein